MALFSSFSHILHGNVLLLKDVLQFKRPNAQKMRVYWFLILSGINCINTVSSFLDDEKIKKKVDEINNEFIELQKKVEKNWAALN